MTEDQKQQAIRQMRNEEFLRESKCLRANNTTFIPISSPQYKPLPPLSAIAQCQMSICKIMATPYPHLGGNLPIEPIRFAKGAQYLMDTLSGKYTPFHGAAEYLQNVRGGKA